MKKIHFALLLPALFIFVAITGFDRSAPEVHPKITVSDNLSIADANKCVPAASEALPFGLLSTEDAPSQLLDTSSIAGPEVCVLEGGANDYEKIQFGLCVANHLSCDDPTKLVDEENGNVVVFCN